MTATIVIADDHRVLREGLRALLETRDDLQIVGEASDGLEVVEQVKALDPDLVLMDLEMPNLSGIAATRRIVGGGSRARVLVLSSYDSRRHIDSAREAGASGYLSKRAGTDELFAAIDAVLSGQGYCSADASSGPRPGLTTREREVLTLVAEGLTGREIATQLGLSPRTAESHRANLMRKLGVHKASGLVRYAVREGLVEP